jgi:hypothetical protein
VAGRVKVKEFAVQHVREPCQRVPVTVFIRSESPFHTFQAQAAVHVGVLDDITIIVVVDEGMVTNRSIERRRCRDEKQTKNCGSLGRPTKRAGI